MGTEFLVFSKVSKSDLDEIDRLRLDFHIRICFDSSTEVLVVKLMAGKAYDWVGRLFSHLLLRKVEERSGNSLALMDMGSFRCVAGERGKEPDVALLPPNRNREGDWPSIVIEVGVSERLGALQSDAHFWISKSGGVTRVVLLIAIYIESRGISIERWGDMPPLYPSHRVGGPSIRPRRKVQSVTIDVNGVVGAPLEVPADLIFDVGCLPMGVLPSDFTFDVAERGAFSAKFWGMLT